MIKSLKLLAPIALSLCVLSAKVEAKTLYFTGTIDPGTSYTPEGGAGALDNAPISGWFEWGLSAPVSVGGDGTTYVIRSGGMPTASPYAVAKFTLPTGTYFTSDSLNFVSGQTLVSRGHLGYDEIDLFAEGGDFDGKRDQGGGEYIAMYVASDTGVTPNVFSDASGGFSDLQPIYFGPGIESGGHFVVRNPGAGSDPAFEIRGSFTVDSITTSSPVAEPEAVAMFGLGLLGLMVQRKRMVKGNAQPH